MYQYNKITCKFYLSTLNCINICHKSLMDLQFRASLIFIFTIALYIQGDTGFLALPGLQQHIILVKAKVEAKNCNSFRYYFLSCKVKERFLRMHQQVLLEFFLKAWKILLPARQIIKFKRDSFVKWIPTYTYRYIYTWMGVPWRYEIEGFLKQSSQGKVALRMRGRLSCSNKLTSKAYYCE